MTLIHHGRPFTTTEAGVWGWSPHDTIIAERRGALRRILRGVYVDAQVPDSRQQRLDAVRLIAPPHAIACNETAAWLYGIDAFKPGEQYLLEPSFLVTHGASRIRRPEVRCRQADVSVDDVDRMGGLWITTPMRTTLDLLRTLYRPYALSAADAMARAALVRKDDIVQQASDMKGFRGIVQARELAAMIDGAAESPGESWMRLRLVDANLPHPVCQFEIIDDFGRTRILDCAYPEVKVGVEYDGRRHHTDPKDQAHDAARRQYLHQVLGWRVVVATRMSVFGPEPALERQVAELMGRSPQLPRLWGTAPIAEAA